MTEHNLFQEVREDMERQRMEALWKRYGLWIIAAAFAVVVGTSGVSAWRGWTASHNQSLTAGYLDATHDQDSDAAKAIASLQQFADGHNGSNQADFALLRAGALAMEKGDTAKAVASFDAVAHDGGADSAFRQLGDLLSVQAQMDAGDATALTARLEPLAQENAPWRYSAQEMQGYLALRAGDADKARHIFTTLAQDARAPQSIGERAADILRSLN